MTQLVLANASKTLHWIPVVCVCVCCQLDDKWFIHRFCVCVVNHIRCIKQTGRSLVYLSSNDDEDDDRYKRERTGEGTGKRAEHRLSFITLGARSLSLSLWFAILLTISLLRLFVRLVGFVLFIALDHRINTSAAAAAADIV